ncbi:MAG: polysaccharide lyase [Armatimonadota bacterium]|jgi:hypothetical protein
MRRVNVYCVCLILAAALVCGCAEQGIGQPTREQAAAALRKAGEFFYSEVAAHGGYVWQYSSDLTWRKGEGRADLDTIWVQPPGTPAVGLAFLEAHEATGERMYLDAAVAAARALVQGQLISGGWGYGIYFDPQKRREHMYRVDAPRSAWGPLTPPDPAGEGWHAWRRRRFKGNRTMMDDNTTQASIRLLVRVDSALAFRDDDIHEAAIYALGSIMMAQYPIGAWSHNYDRYPSRPPDAETYPVIRASYPESWSRTWTKDFTGCYMINDHITPDGVEALLAAHQAYGDDRYLEAAKRGGQFLLLAQMPDPQPAWAQQYNSEMHPVWDRAFEPPAISGWESQGVMETLLLLYRPTGERKYLEAVARTLPYLRGSLLPDGRLARFYELRSNRPLYFTKDYKLTYDAKEMPDHYGFAFDSRLDEIEAEYRRLAAANPATLPDEPEPDLTDELRGEVQRIIGSMDERGAWLGEKGLIHSQTFIDNVATLCRFIQRN